MIVEPRLLPRNTVELGLMWSRTAVMGRYTPGPPFRGTPRGASAKVLSGR